MDAKTQRGALLKELRKQKKMNQTEVAAILGVSQQAYQMYESGASEPKYDTLVKIADFYGVSTDFLLGRDAEKPNTFAMPMDGIEKQLFEAYFQIPPEHRAKILQKIAYIAAHSQSITQDTTVGAELQRAADAAEAEAGAETSA